MGAFIIVYYPVIMLRLYQSQNKFDAPHRTNQTQCNAEQSRKKKLVL